jgi:hypothetical protein
MTSITNNPTQDVFEMVLARPVAAPDPQHGRLVHLLWRAPQQGERLVQFYLNGRLAGSSHSPLQREAWLLVDHARHTQIELLAVCPAEASVDRRDYLAGVDPQTQPAVSLRLLRDESLPIDSTISIAVNEASNPDQSLLFSPGDPRGGFGAVFGEGGFGYDASIGPGLGCGALGDGPLGSDGYALYWLDDTLPIGPHAIGLSLVDEAGLPAADDLHLMLSTDRLPLPPVAVSLNDELNLTWT